MTGKAELAQIVAGKRRAEHGRPVETLLETADVVAVLAGGAGDGHDLVTVWWRGSEITARYCERYTPVVGHTVLIGHSGDTAYIFDRLIGTPI